MLDHRLEDAVAQLFRQAGGGALRDEDAAHHGLRRPVVGRRELDELIVREGLLDLGDLLLVVAEEAQRYGGADVEYQTVRPIEQTGLHQADDPAILHGIAGVAVAAREPIGLDADQLELVASHALRRAAARAAAEVLAGEVREALNVAVGVDEDVVGKRAGHPEQPEIRLRLAFPRPYAPLVLEELRLSEQSPVRFLAGQPLAVVDAATGLHDRDFQVVEELAQHLGLSHMVGIERRRLPGRRDRQERLVFGKTLRCRQAGRKRGHRRRCCGGSKVSKHSVQHDRSSFSSCRLLFRYPVGGNRRPAAGEEVNV